MISPARPVIVFTGPTLSRVDAEALLPGALVLPPARCGDLLAALRLSPRVLVLIDGLFERTPAVWHKEISVAVEQGVVVVGAASMGALRAAEMDAYGMIGIGGIYLDYRDGRLRDDDEVAVVHTTEDEPLSQAMVDIRATVARALDEAILTPALAEQILAAAKRLFYPERTLTLALGSLPDTDEARRFADWAANGGFVNRKRQDAVLVLSQLGRYSAERPQVRVPQTVRLRELQRTVDCRPIRGLNPGLPRHERVLQAARFLGHAFVEAKQLARLLATLHHLASTAPFRDTAPARRSTSPLWQSLLDTHEWRVENACSDAEHSAFKKRVQTVDRLEQTARQPPEDVAPLLRHHLEAGHRRHLRWVEILATDARGAPLAPPDPDAPARQRFVARLWSVIDRLGRNAGIVPQPALLRRGLEDLCRDRGIFDLQSAARWLNGHGVDRYELGALLLAHYRLALLTVEHQLVCLGVESAAKVAAPAPWLLDATRLCGLYRRAASLLDARPDERVRTAILPDDLAQALARDFETEQPALLRRELRAL